MSAELLLRQGDSKAALGDLKGALATYESAVGKYPQSAEAWLRHGAALSELKRPVEALTSYARAEALSPGRPDLCYSRAVALEELGRAAEALEDYDRALSGGLDFAMVWNNRGTCLRSLGRWTEALQSFDRALALDPDHVEAMGNLGAVLQRLGRHQEALAAFERFSAAAPGHKYALAGLLASAAALCDWNILERLRPRLESEIASGKSIVNPFFFLSISDDPVLARQCAAHYGRDLIGDLPKVECPMPVRGEKIRLAYFSTDFRLHAVGHLMIGIMEHHDRSRFELIGVSYGPEEASPLRGRFKKAFDHFIDAEDMPDADIVASLRALKVDIAVDLSGYARGARPKVMAMRPAPVQLSYLGFPASMAADFMDGVIADAIVLPKDQQENYSERILRLPDCYWPATAHDPGQAIAPIPSRAEAGLPETGFVFGCFNHHGKICREQFTIWMRLLAKVPGAVLWLIEDGGKDNLARAAAEVGIDPARLIFAPKRPQAEHLARCALIDLALDTLPYNAHTTCTDALRMGVPMITVAGRSFASRVGASMLAAAGLPELIAEDAESYEALALALARDPECLARLRARLGAARFSLPLFDVPVFMRHWEALFAAIMPKA
jgi:predicted O-linked N-acetylglucosamine transferase (SPINDLY family)